MLKYIKGPLSFRFVTKKLFKLLDLHIIKSFNSSNIYTVTLSVKKKGWVTVK